MICILHGYLLEGSGSNLWTRAIIESLCRQGENVHLMAQENHPERYDFISETRRYLPGGDVEVTHSSAPATPGCCVMHKPELGDLLPVYVWDSYEEFPRVVPMVDLATSELEVYMDRNVRALMRVVEENGITAIHANHSVLMSVVAQRVSERTGVPFAIMPHGSALEFAVKRDARFHRWAVEAFSAASVIFVHGEEMRNRVRDTLPSVPGLEEKFSDLHLGVDTRQFEPVPREGRPANIERLNDALRGLPRGRTPEMTTAMLSRLRHGMNEEELLTAFEPARAFDGKRPDAAVEAKLAAIDWVNDPVVLFVGRLISTKGIHGVIVALPLLLRERPDLRLVIVGHGPLREPLEALVWALSQGDMDMVRLIVDRGRALEGAPEGEGDSAELSDAAAFLDRLEARGLLDDYAAAAGEFVRPGSVVFTGYLTHRELHHLFPCCDAAVFPSVVKEAGPLVFLEALASGTFPLGTYFGGMQASIDSIADAIPPSAVESMKLSPEPGQTVDDIVSKLPRALAIAGDYREPLFRAARERYDWTSVARKFADELEGL